MVRGVWSCNTVTGQGIQLSGKLGLAYDANCNNEIKGRTVMGKQTSIARDEILINGLKKELKKGMMKVFVMSVVLWGEETWTLRKMIAQHLKHSHCGCGEEWKNQLAIRTYNKWGKGDEGWMLLEAREMWQHLWEEGHRRRRDDEESSCLAGWWMTTTSDSYNTLLIKERRKSTEHGRMEWSCHKRDLSA